MDKKKSNYLSRENFLISLLNKVMKEYKALIETIRQIKPLKIIKIQHISSIPGETQFTIQITNKNCFLTYTAAEIINHGYSLDDFNEFHAEMIRQAAQGKLIDFLKIKKPENTYKIVSKKLDRESQQYIFTIETKEKERFIRNAEELSINKNLLENMDLHDIYDIGYTNGFESILKEKANLLLTKNTN